MKLLLVEDESGIAREVKKALERENFIVHWAATAAEAIKSESHFQPELVVLDLGLPDMDGLEVLNHLRQQNPSLLVLVLTARDSLDSKVKSLDMGAEDYLLKPFEMPELLARLRVLARRLGTANNSTIQIGGVAMDVAAHTVAVDQQAVDLSRREYTTLKILLENAGRIQTKEALESKLYGWSEEVASNAIEVHISNLRKKLPPGLIKTIRGVGYTIDKPSQTAET